MIKKVIFGIVFLISLPGIYIIGPLFLPYRAVVSIYYQEPHRTQVLSRLDAEALKEARR